MNNKPKPKNKPISLYPLSVEEIVEAMLKTPPMPKGKKQKTNKRKKSPAKKKRVTV